MKKMVPALLCLLYSCSSADSTEKSLVQKVEELQRRTDSLQAINTNQNILQLQKDEVNRRLTERNMEYRNNWDRYIKASANKYNGGNFWHGVENLEITVTNRTKCPVDEVIVTVNYLNGDGSTCETKEVSVTNINPGADKLVKVPNNICGKRIEYEISNIQSRSFHFCYTGPVGDVTYIREANGDSRNVENKDPWFCK